MFAARHVTQKLKAQALSEMNAENCLNWMEVIAKFQEVHFHDSQYLPLGCTCRFMMAHQGNMGYLRFGKSLSTRQAWWHDEWSCVAIRLVAGESEVNMGNGSKFCYHFWDRRTYGCAHIWKNLFRKVMVGPTRMGSKNFDEAKAKSFGLKVRCAESANYLQKDNLGKPFARCFCATCRTIKTDQELYSPNLWISFGFNLFGFFASNCRFVFDSDIVCCFVCTNISIPLNAHLTALRSIKENQSWYEVGPAWVDARCTAGVRISAWR